jgi:pyruvate formate lyase activating enzyme
MKRALIGSIGRGSLYDGPGIRTVVFFKGCPLHCPWCHNPEFLSPQPEIAFYPVRCIGCGDCVAVCPEGAASLELVGRVDRARCTGCGLCARKCPARALELVGERYSVDELAEIVMRDRLFYKISGGGVTLSGGEPAAQLDFISPLLERLKQEKLHTAIETNGVFLWDEFESCALDRLDLILFDLKLADSAEHRRLTSAGNEKILVNLTRLMERRPEDVIVRIPLIPGYTATAENLTAVRDLLRGLKARHCALLPYHPFGLSKAGNIGRVPTETLPRKSMEPVELGRWQRFFDWSEIIEF